MFKRDSSGDIYHTRGDTGTLELDVTFNGAQSNTQEWTAVLSVKKKLNSKDYLFQKKFKDGVCKITQSDTQDLKAGSYYYDVQITANIVDEEGNFQETVVQTVGPRNYYLLADVTVDILEDEDEE